MNNRIATLEDAIQIAAQAYKGQTDKAGKPYILHPLRMMMQMKTEAEMMTAILHDVVEDSNWTLDMLREKGFSEEVLEAVECVTNREDESYEQFIERAGKNSIARRVKIADLEDNMDVKRLETLTAKDADRIAKYLRAWTSLSLKSSKADTNISSIKSNAIPNSTKHFRDKPFFNMTTEERAKYEQTSNNLVEGMIEGNAEVDRQHNKTD